ncbi:hypothetical protein NQ315_015475 [Exocentrus adspersus]|uniref:Peptidase M13 N-terminal domain-containing protein n=1 Tax=Exocentrus adspersus TaxID=1586481 RepID=A0AAV8VNY2_9CUCU|nr:hypothetical protein NQ315_015475 [Exocentrus adspersus]
MLKSTTCRKTQFTWLLLTMSVFFSILSLAERQTGTLCTPQEALTFRCRRQAEKSTLRNTKPKSKICTSDECLRTATNLKYSIDFTADPCSNFYQYTCGKWPEEHPNHGWWSSFSSFTTISERVAISSLTALASKPSSDDEPKSLQKSRDFYKSCMDIDPLDRLGLTAMYKYITRAKLPVVPSLFTLADTEKDTFSFDWVKSETLIKQIFMMDVFIGFVIDANIYNGSENVIYIGQLYQKCPLPSPIKQKMTYRLRSGTEYQELIRERQSNTIKYIIKEIITNTTSVQPVEDVLNEAANIILDMADYIEELNMNYTNPDETEEDTFSMTFSDIQSQTDIFLEERESNFWMSYFENLFTGTNITIDPETDLLYTTQLDVQYLLRILKYILESSKIHVELYMWWTIVYAMIINTSSDMVEYINKQLVYHDTENAVIARSRSLECALLVNNYMGFAVSYVLADEAFPMTTKPKVSI